MHFFSLFMILFFGVGCGHPASQPECDQILDKIVDLELAKQNVKDPATIAQRKDDARKATGQDLMQRCLGRRVTQSAMTCVRKATSYEQIENQCLH